MSPPSAPSRDAPRRFPWRLALGAALVAAMIAAALLLRRPDYEPSVYEFRGETMATTYSVKVIDPNAHAEARRAMERGIAGELDLVNFTMSRFDPESELYRFNQRRDTALFAMSEAAIEVIAAARRLSEETDGAYDVTVAPLMRLWGFWGRAPRQTMPSAEEIAAAKAEMGWQRYEVDAKERTVRKLVPAIELDLSSIAKGAAVDRLANMFEAFRYESYMVEIGGEVRCHGVNPEGKPWRIGIETPVAGKREVREVIALRDRAMATSGDYRQSYLLDGTRVSHTMDPRTGRPIAHGLAAVTVLHEECMLADGWATALTVLGPEAGYDLAVAKGLAVLFVVRAEDGRLRERATPAFLEARESKDPPRPAAAD